jgi:shikimate dehydrogenase
MRIDGNTELIAHIGFPTHSFKAPLIYNPWFESIKSNTLVVPMACDADGFPSFLQAVFSLQNIRGALITMPHKVSILSFLDELSPTARIAGACNAVKKLPNGRLVGDMFDGEGFVRGILRKGLSLLGGRALVVGCGGVGSAIAASLAAHGITQLGLYDERSQSAQQLAQRLAEHYPQLAIILGTKNPNGFELLVNASPLGMEANDPLPFDTSELKATQFVGEVVMARTMTPLLRQAQAKGCTFQVGTDMLFEQIPAYLEFFGLPTTTPEKLRELSWV